MVQIIESSPLGLRSARLTLENENPSVSFTLYPMIHLGEISYYETIEKELAEHDLVLVEGVKSPIVSRITSSYRWAAAAPALGLILQSSVFRDTVDGQRVIHADLKQDEFEAYWRRVPLWLRFFAFVLAPYIGFKRRFSASRKDFADGMSMNDIASRDEILSWDARFDSFYHAILHARDQRLVEVIAENLDTPKQGIQRIAVVFGARHMRAVIDYLTAERGYRVASGSWLTVFRL